MNCKNYVNVANVGNSRLNPPGHSGQATPEVGRHKEWRSFNQGEKLIILVTKTGAILETSNSFKNNWLVLIVTKNDFVQIISALFIIQLKKTKILVSKQ